MELQIFNRRPRQGRRIARRAHDNNGVVPTRRVAVIGGGILGVAVAREILKRSPDADVTLFEKEDRLAAHQTGRNSGVVHAGLYYEPGSNKAVLCRRGVALLEDFCAERGIRRIACGKVLVALDEDERARLDNIEERALANGVPGCPDHRCRRAA